MALPSGHFTYRAIPEAHQLKLENIMAKGKKNVAVEAVAAAEVAEAAVNAVAEVKGRGPRGVSEDAVISMLVGGNPKREGSKAHGRFALYADGMTVGEALDAGITTPDLVYDTKHGFVSISGYDAGEIIVAKPKAPKAEKAPRTAKGGKVKAVKSADQEAAEAEVAEATSEESMD